MSDSHSNRVPSLKGSSGQENESNIQELDADRAARSSKYHQHYELHDSRYWHAACWVRDCKLGIRECKVGSSCCKAGWRNALEEPLRHSRSLVTAFKRPESVAMLTSLLSNLSVSRTRSDPCIFGKDLLRITLPLPGEWSDCGAKGHAVDTSESRAMDEAINPVGSGTGEDNPEFEASTSPFTLTCKAILPKRIASSEYDSLFCGQNCVAYMRDDDESMHNIPGLRLHDINEHKIHAPTTSSLRNDMGVSQDFGKIFSDGTLIGSLSQTPFDENAATNSHPIEEVSSQTPQWDNLWASKSYECSQRSKHGDQRRMQYRNRSEQHYLTSAEVIGTDLSDEEGSDEGYLILEEHVGQRLQRFEDKSDVCDFGEKESMFHGKQYINNDCLEENFCKEGEVNNDISSKEYKEDDIWSDEQFVSSQVKGFPPPISILANETHPGLPGHMPKTLWRSVKRDGRFVLQEVQAQPREFFRATRECGRLRLQLVRPDSDPLESNSEVVGMSSDDCTRQLSIQRPSHLVNIAGISDTNEFDDCGVVYQSDTSGTSPQAIDAFQSEFCCTAERGAKFGGALDKDNLKLARGLMTSTSLSKEYGSVLSEEKLGAYSGQNCKEMVGGSSSSDAGLNAVRDSISRGVTNNRQIYEGSWEVKTALFEILNKTTNQIIAHEYQSSDLREDKVGMVSELVKVENREKPALEVGTPLHTGVKLNVVQFDGEWKVEKMADLNLCTMLDVRKAENVEDLGIGSPDNVVMPPTVHSHEDKFNQDYQHPCFNSTYGFDNNLKVLSPSRPFIQFPIQPAVR